MRVAFRLPEDLSPDLSFSRQPGQHPWSAVGSLDLDASVNLPDLTVVTLEVVPPSRKGTQVGLQAAREARGTPTRRPGRVRSHTTVRDFRAKLAFFSQERA